MCEFCHCQYKPILGLPGRRQLGYLSGQDRSRDHVTDDPTSVRAFHIHVSTIRDCRYVDIVHK